MGAHRERRHDETPERASATAAVPAPVTEGLSPETLNRAGVIALQRLVGNAAVVEMMQARERPGEQKASDAPDSGRAEADRPQSPPADVIEAALAIAAGAGRETTAEAALANGVAPGLAPAVEAAPANGVSPGPASSGSPAVEAAPANGVSPGPASSGSPAVEAAPANGEVAGAGAYGAGAPAPTLAVARAVAEAPAAAPGRPAAPGEGDIRDPHDDPGFKSMKGATKSAGTKSKTHQPAAQGAATAQGAAVAPANDAPSQAAAAQVDEMGKQQPGVFDKKAFIAAVRAAIDKATPKNLEEADDFKGSGKAGQAKDEVQGLVKGGKKESEKDIKEKTEAAPDTSKATPKPVTPMVNDEPGAPPSDVGAADAMPKTRPPGQTDLSGGPADVDAKMAEAEVTDEQLQKSNEPEFTGALEAKDAAKQHSATAPADYRAKEGDVLAKGKGEAEATAGSELDGMHGARTDALSKVVGKKGETKTADEEKRSKVATDIQGIYDKTKSDVTKTLEALDGKVDAAFTKGEGAARKQFEDYHEKRMNEYKDERYGQFGGSVLWAKDKLFGMPDEVNRFYEEGKRGYLTAMDGVVSEVADIVGNELTAARTRITEGRADIQKYVAQLPADLKQVGQEAAEKLESQFDQLSSDVDSKQDALVETLAKKYTEARDELDKRINELQAANKGWVDKALDAVVGVVQTILKLKDMLMNVLSRAADAIGLIIKDPIGFLGNLVEGVKGGLMAFVGNIAGHLKDGLMGWLFGALGSAGITLPKSLDFQGILDLVLQVLGLTYQNIRGRIAKLVGEPLVAKMEKTVEVLKDFATKGIAGAWEWIKDKIGDLEEMVLGQIKEFVIEKVIKSGIVWIISLLNPAAAFVKACKAIYDIVMFIVERGSEIMEFVNAIIDSITAIAKGSVGVVVEKIEAALAKALPLAISFLASLLGLGGISEKIRSVIDAVRAPINKAIDFVVGGAVKAFKKMFGPAINWVKGKYEKGKAFVKGKVEAGKKFVKGKVDAGKAFVKGKVDAGKTFVKGKVEAGKDFAKEKAADARDWLREKLGFKVSTPVRMGDEAHTLSAVVEGEDNLELNMASTPGTLIAKLNAALGKSEGEDRDKIQALIGECDAVTARMQARIKIEIGHREALYESGQTRGYKEDSKRAVKLLTQMATTEIGGLAGKLGGLSGIDRVGGTRIKQIDRELLKLRKELETKEADIAADIESPLFKVGNPASMSLPTASAKVTSKQKAAIQGPPDLRPDCHHKDLGGCDEVSSLTPDHQPPSELMTIMFKGKPLIPQQAQQLYPQCAKHSDGQGAKVKNLRKRIQDHQLALDRIDLLEGERKSWENK